MTLRLTLVVALMLAVGLLGYSRLGELGARAERVGTTEMPALSAIRAVDAASMDYRGTQYAILATDEVGHLAEQRAHLKLSAEAVQAALDAARPLMTDQVDRARFAQVRAAWQRYRAATTHGTALELDVAETGYTAMQADIDSWASDAQVDAAEAVEEARAIRSRARTELLLLMLAGLLVPVLYVVSVSLRGPARKPSSISLSS